MAMAAFQYQARDAAGKQVSGNVDAGDQAAAAAILMDRGLMVISMKAVTSRKARVKKRQGKIKSQDLVVFTRQLATMMDAGLPLVQSMTALEEPTESKVFKPILRQITDP